LSCGQEYTPTWVALATYNPHSCFLLPRNGNKKRVFVLWAGIHSKNCTRRRPAQKNPAAASLGAAGSVLPNIQCGLQVQPTTKILVYLLKNFVFQQHGGWIDALRRLAGCGLRK
jgi:hypothetical protein